jgi:hypothetical protein
LQKFAGQTPALPLSLLSVSLSLCLSLCRLGVRPFVLACTKAATNTI